MVKERMDLLGLLRERGSDGDVDLLREALRVLVEGIMDAEVSSRIGAEYGERSPERVTQRNGHRSRAWDTRVGTMELRIPKLREGSYIPSLLEPRRRTKSGPLLHQLLERWCSSFIANPAPGTSGPLLTPSSRSRQRRRGCLEITAEASRTGLALITCYSTIRDLLVLASSANCKRRS